MKQLLILIFCSSSLLLVSQDVVVEVEGDFADFAIKDNESIFVPSFEFGANYEKLISEKTKCFHSPSEDFLKISKKINHKL